MYRIGELAEIKGVSKRTIDYYTQLGLLNPIRTESNYRLYGEENVRILELVDHYKKLNVPLNEMKSVITSNNLNSNDEIDREKVEAHVEQIAGVMQHLQKELKEIKPILDKLNDQQKEVLMNKVSPQSITLAQTLVLLFS
ncbi:MerR family transcriptional regulator [Litchfieldia salsa]|uniref:DNA-binding transcriptional regulator, MerR family n=1 Tax=Litchfieldia salsa TaxID=930152 RepID=A0A1H0VKH3_9BACI|nr:MerR family transcriptional regulator [Litchfieldia salsa]SDP78791.1 DNA-binding transcriptional regulator, MerR family [Litchfieldia salsa]